MPLPIKPLTADEVATWKQLIAQDARLSEQQKLAMERFIATIEQQAEQIEKLRKVIYTAAVAFRCSRRPNLRKMCDEILAATEPNNG